MERTAPTSQKGQSDQYDVVRTSPFQFAQTAIGRNRVVRVGEVDVLGSSISVGAPSDPNSTSSKQ